MPYIDVSLSDVLAQETEQQLKSAFGKLIERIPGKTEDYLMVQFHDRCRLWFRGKNEEPNAMVNVMLYGKAGQADYQHLADGILEALSQTAGVPVSNIYVKFEEVPNWFWG